MEIKSDGSKDFFRWEKNHDTKGRSRIGMAGAAEGKLAYVILKISSWSLSAADEVRKERQNQLF